jgi:hypothetical protein
LTFAVIRSARVEILRSVLGTAAYSLNDRGQITGAYQSTAQQPRQG